MKALMMIAFAGAMLTSVSVAGTNDQWAEERLKAKTGRYSPAEESRRAKPASGAKHAADVCQNACCRHEQSTVPKRTEEFMAAKFGRKAATVASHHKEQHAARGEPSDAANRERAKFGCVLSKTADEQANRQSTPEVAVCHMCSRNSCCD